MITLLEDVVPIGQLDVIMPPDRLIVDAAGGGGVIHDVVTVGGDGGVWLNCTVIPLGLCISTIQSSG